jgi:hypothetical protein
VQDRYAGDAGDFLKLGLMRHLAASTNGGGPGLVVGLNWYLAPDEGHNADGKHIAYLRPANRQHASLAACDPELILCLAHVAAGDRSVEALESSGALPHGSPTHAERLDPTWSSTRRLDWHRRALRALAGADVVFTDPDNGLCSVPGKPRLHKYSLLSELVDYARRGQSLIAYQHAGRSLRAELQARQRLDQLATGVGQEPVGAIIARRGSCRFFLVTATAAQRTRLAAAVAGFAVKWSPHAELVVPGPAI